MEFLHESQQQQQQQNQTIRVSSAKTLSSNNNNTNVKHPTQKSKPTSSTSNDEITKNLQRTVNTKPKSTIITKSDKPRSAPTTTAGKKVKEILI